MTNELQIFSDGAARGNPGEAGAGAILVNSKGEIVKEVCRYLGDNLTNNQAEYFALILALEEAKKKNAVHLKIFADSELMVRQLKGEYKVKNEGLKTLFQKAHALLQNFSGYSIDHVPREKNKHADKLANKAIDEKS